MEALIIISDLVIISIAIWAIVRLYKKREQTAHHKLAEEIKKSILEDSEKEKE